MNEAQIIGVLAAIFVSVGSLWQLYKILKTKDTSAIKYPWLIFVNCSLLLWMAYGIALNDWILIIPNIFITALYSFFMVLKFHYER